MNSDIFEVTDGVAGPIFEACLKAMVCGGAISGALPDASTFLESSLERRLVL